MSHAGERTWRDEDTENFPAPFIVAVLRRLTLLASGDVDPEADLELCEYHDHENYFKWGLCLGKGLVSDMSDWLEDSLEIAQNIGPNDDGSIAYYINFDKAELFRQIDLIL